MSHILGRPWSTHEDAAIRAGYSTRRIAALAVELDRTESAVFHRAARIGVVKSRRWTAADENALRFAWGEVSLKRLALQLNRSAITVYWRAQKLGLALGCPEGYEYLSHAAARTGYATGQLRRILDWAGVKLRRSMSRNLAHSWRAPHFAVPFDVDDAIARWHRTETVENAARRYGLGGDTLRGWLVEAIAGGADVPPKPAGRRVHWRVPSEALDQVVAARSSRRRAA